jgi:hypothetical protein
MRKHPAPIVPSREGRGGRMRRSRARVHFPYFLSTSRRERSPAEGQYKNLKKMGTLRAMTTFESTFSVKLYPLFLQMA